MATPKQMKASAEALMQKLIGRSQTEFAGMHPDELSGLMGESTSYDNMAAALGAKPPKGIKEVLKGSIGKGALGGALLFWALQNAIRDVGDIASTGLQTGAIKNQTQNLSAEDLLYQAMLPDLQARSQLAREALMNQLGGVHGPSGLASGESFVGE